MVNYPGLLDRMCRNARFVQYASTHDLIKHLSLQNLKRYIATWFLMKCMCAKLHRMDMVTIDQGFDSPDSFNRPALMDRVQPGPELICDHTTFVTIKSLHLP